MRRAAALVLILGAILAAAGCGGASEEDVEQLEARVAALEAEVATLEEETAAVRAVAGRLDELEDLIEGLRESLPDLDELPDLLAYLEELRELVPDLDDLRRAARAGSRTSATCSPDIEAFPSSNEENGDGDRRAETGVHDRAGRGSGSAAPTGA